MNTETQIKDTGVVCTPDNFTISREKIDENKNIKLTDTQDGLEMFCSVNSDNSLILKRTRGIIFDGNIIVSRGYPHCDEFTSDQPDMIKSFLNNSLKDCSIYDAHEGAMIRVFYYSNRWWVVTHKKLDAFASKWSSSESFGDMFVKSLEAEIENNVFLKKKVGSLNGKDTLHKFYSTLDRNNQYMFLVRNNKDNRIVCNAPERYTLYHVGTIVNGQYITMSVDIGIPKPRKHDFTSIDELLEFVNTLSYKEYQGVIVFTNTMDGDVVKIFTPEYREFFAVRGNEPILKMRYLQVRLSAKQNNLIYQLYPEMASEFDEIENNLYDLAKTIMESYKTRYIKPFQTEEPAPFVRIPDEEFTILKTLHEWHKEDRKSNRVSVQKVIEIMNKQSANSLFKMLRRQASPNEQTENKTKTPSLLLNAKYSKDKKFLNKTRPSRDGQGTTNSVENAHRNSLKKKFC